MEAELFSKRNLLAASIAGIVFTQTAIAQNQEEAPLVALEEVTVTATKRSANLQDIPLSVTAISGEQMKDMQINDILDIDKTVPGMKVVNSGNDPQIIMRGAGAAGTHASAVPVYIDNSYRPRNGQALAAYLDVDRVEILRGPQGTLFGRNTMGGLMNVISNKPDFEEFSYGGAVTVGNYALRTFEGYVNVPLTDSLAARFTGMDTFHDPYVENTYNADGGLKDADMSYGRVQLAFVATDNFDLNFTASYWKDTANGNADYAYKVLGVPVNPDTGLTDGVNGELQDRQGTSSSASGGRPQAGNWPNDWTAGTSNDPYQIAFDYTPSRDIKEVSYSLTANWDLNFATLRAMVTQFDYEEYRLTDSDLSPNPGANITDEAPAAGCEWWYYDTANTTRCGLVAGQRVNSKAIQGDIALSSSGEGAFDWTIGYYFYDSSKPGDSSGEFVWGYTTSADPQNPRWAHWLYQGQGGTKSQAVYGQAEYSVTDKLRATLGLRYSEDESNFSQTGLASNADRNAPWPGPFEPTTEAITSHGKDDNVDYRVAFQYDLSEDHMVYGSKATAYISGGPKGGGSIELNPANTLDAWEFGWKSTLMDGAMRFNAVAYFNQFEGLTTTQYVEQGGTIVSQTVFGGAMDTKGVELEMSWQATDALFVNAIASFDFSEMGEFYVPESRFETGAAGCDVNGNFVADVHCLEGGEARFSPDYTLGLGVAYTMNLGGLGELVPGAYIYMTDDYKTQNEPYFFAEQKGYTTVDLRAVWYSPIDGLTANLFVKNATNEAYMTNTTVFSKSRAMADYNAPRTYGLRVAYNF